MVQLELTDTIQLTTKFAIQAPEFFTNDLRSTFISNLCALLGITDYSRVKIVGIRTGSVIIDTLITEPVSTETNSGTSTGNPTNPTNPPSAQPSVKDINKKLN